jgi:hypothetical protein
MSDTPKRPDIPMPPNLVVLSDDDVRAGFDGPAFASNRIFTTISAMGVRIAFMEQSDTSTRPHFRTAVVISFDDAVILRDVLNLQIQRFAAGWLSVDSAKK